MWLLLQSTDHLLCFSFSSLRLSLIPLYFSYFPLRLYILFVLCKEIHFIKAQWGGNGGGGQLNGKNGKLHGVSECLSHVNGKLKER